MLTASHSKTSGKSNPKNLRQITQQGTNCTHSVGFLFTLLEFLLSETVRDLFTVKRNGHHFGDGGNRSDGSEFKYN